jgi:hypothetical protein
MNIVVQMEWNFFRLEEDSSAARCQFCGKEVNKMFLNLSKTHPSGNNESNETKFYTSRFVSTAGFCFVLRS